MIGGQYESPEQIEARIPLGSVVRVDGSHIYYANKTMRVVHSDLEGNPYIKLADNGLYYQVHCTERQRGDSYWIGAHLLEVISQP